MHQQLQKKKKTFKLYPLMVLMKHMYIVINLSVTYSSSKKKKKLYCLQQYFHHITIIIQIFVIHNINNYGLWLDFCKYIILLHYEKSKNGHWVIMVNDFKFLQKYGT